MNFSQYHHPSYRSKAFTKFSSRSYEPEEQNRIHQRNSPPPVIFGQRVTAENRYAGHLNTIDLNSNKMEILKDEYFDYDEYVDDYYDYGYEGNSHFNSNSSSPVISVHGNTHIPLRSPNSNPTSPRMPQHVPNRRNSYMHYNHHGTYLPLSPSHSETHYSSYEHANRRPHRY